MKRHFLLQIALAFALLLGIVAYASRLLNLTGSWTLDLAGDDIATLAPATKRYLRSLETPLSITYFATARENMPAHLKELEPQVRRLLSALRDQAPGRIDYRVIDPDQSGRAGIGYAASKRASSFSVRRVLHDEHSEQKIWSSLVIARADAPEVLVQSIEPEHLPYLEEYVIAQLQAGRAPPQPTFGVSAPPPFQLLAAFLNEAGPVVELDLNSNPTIPPEI
ncbi:MAG: Gldg family protein, partial [Gemmatimonadetes bacterium]|nr:Gldg family protein [Gemmatimonadota bacterium]